ncbi:hypothetical protein FKP32DRAFT_995386 [Trametes sanguinea]|nr:hypothetical protein FKP32DRAFT_995386 [Trametes sanguinea]
MRTRSTRLKKPTVAFEAVDTPRPSRARKSTSVSTPRRPRAASRSPRTPTTASSAAAKARPRDKVQRNCLLRHPAAPVPKAQLPCEAYVPSCHLQAPPRLPPVLRAPRRLTLPVAAARSLPPSWCRSNQRRAARPRAPRGRH